MSMMYVRILNALIGNLMKNKVVKMVSTDGTITYLTNYDCTQEEAKKHFDSLSEEEKIITKGNIRNEQ